MSLALDKFTGSLRPQAKSESTAASERIVGLDALRGSAMILGIFLHAALAYITVKPSGLVWPVASPETEPVCNYIICWIHSFRLQIFFVLSGYFSELLIQKRGLHSFLQQRIQRIFWPYVLSLVFIGGLTLLIAAWGFVISGYVSWNDLISGQIPENSRIKQGGIGPGHLWFLQDLLILSVLYVFLRQGLVPQTNLQSSSNALKLPIVLQPLLFVIPTFFLMWGNISLVTSVNNSFLPDASRLFYYGCFYLIGSSFYRNRKWFEQITGEPGQHLMIASLFSIPLVYYTTQVSTGGPLVILLASLANAVVVWYSIFGWFGLFLHWWQVQSPAVRYLSDASYWIYLSHLPIVLLLQILLFESPLAPFLKFTLVSFGTFVITLLSYQLFVRHSWIGLMLHGKR